MVLDKSVKELIECYMDDIEADKYDNVMCAAYKKNVYDKFLCDLAEVGILVSDGLTRPYCFRVNTTLMPSYLTKACFDDFLEKFQEALEKIFSKKKPFVGAGITVAFSDKEKKRHYGITIEELKDIIREKWGAHEEIEKILDEIQTGEDYEGRIQELMGAIHRIYPDGDCHNPEELYSLRKELEFETTVLGEYINSEKLILLYTPNIEKAAKEHGNPCPREFEKVFAHEFFHAYHYAMSAKELSHRRDYTARVVKESLASAFEWFYCVENGIKGAAELESSWDKHAVQVYPYSGAERLIKRDLYAKKGLLDKTKFAEIFEKSLEDMDTALRMLVLGNVFYDIKNRVLVRRAGGRAASLREIFDALMKSKKVAQIAQDEIPPIVAKNPSLVTDLLDAAYCERKFGISAPLLSTTQVYFPSGRAIYYAKPRVSAGGKKYFLYMHWYKEKHLKHLLDWIFANR